MALRGVDTVRAAFDGPTRRSLIVDANDGIIATSGVVEGFAAAGWNGAPLVLGALCSMIAGGMAVGGMRFVEEESERDARRMLIAEESEQLARSPETELAELAALYEARGCPRSWPIRSRSSCPSATR